jgi:hypothetical protein
MQNAFNQAMSLLQQGIAAVFHFIQLIWNWSVTQIGALTQVSWQNWPLWKQILLVVVVAGVVWAIYRVVAELWEAGERILSAFAVLLGALVRTLPSIAMAGVIALGGLWVLNNVDLSSVHLTQVWRSDAR